MGPEVVVNADSVRKCDICVLARTRMLLKLAKLCPLIVDHTQHQARATVLPAHTFPNDKVHVRAYAHTTSMHAPAGFHTGTEGLTIPVYFRDNGLKIVKIAFVPRIHRFESQV